MDTPDEDMAVPQRVYPQAPMHQVEIVGALWQVQFAQMCVRCGEVPIRTFAIDKLFCRKNPDILISYVIGTVEAPVCAQCLQLQSQEQAPVSAPIRQRLLRRWLVEVLPSFFPFGCALWFLTIVIPLFSKSLVHHNHFWEPLLIGGLCAFFGGIAWAFYNMARERGKQLIFDSGFLPPDTYVQIETGPLGCRFIVPTEPTSLQRSVNFTDDISEVFDVERHLYIFENPAVATKFAELNAGRTWDPNTPRARRAAGARSLMIVLVGMYLAYELVMSLFGRK